MCKGGVDETRECKYPRYLREESGRVAVTTQEIGTEITEKCKKG